MGAWRKPQYQPLGNGEFDSLATSTKLGGDVDKKGRCKWREDFGICNGGACDGEQCIGYENCDDYEEEE